MVLCVPVLFHPSKPISRLSGISYFIDRDHRFYTLQVPWDEHTGIIRSNDGETEHDNKHLLATALRDEVHDEPHPDRLRGLVVHDRCWQVLRKHRIWKRSGEDIDQITRALLSRTARDWERTPLIPLALDLNEHWRNPIASEETDPLHSRYVQYLICRARRRTHRRFKVMQNRQKNHLNRLPGEVLFLIADLLQSPEIVAVQQAIGTYLGDVYWRSRIPMDLFHELRELLDQTLDWEFLCLELEKYNIEYPDDVDEIPAPFNQLLGRKWVLEQLDEIEHFVS
ncbi:hypothetical protein ASPVEDRAFT_191120 [Aspergillus versicolor CBS 583.65]|uniref:Uncharacterized protein n=1 Tax=Aspergillus versicolor CBS 583.65 TaxID=1036611 RepID=A0A1L9PII5_ASPVE|nr:uncharacterized protein ASPVEDRAFT_191120 [Aspergillus versicolor CBS 583.65]OJJ01318.1 hypothetical protein ASPVEDRAFT_191120 [Aspergillus versicolor CBS 583.65]